MNLSESPKLFIEWDQLQAEALAAGIRQVSAQGYADSRLRLQYAEDAAALALGAIVAACDLIEEQDIVREPSPDGQMVRAVPAPSAIRLADHASAGASWRALLAAIAIGHKLLGSIELAQAGAAVQAAELRAPAVRLPSALQLSPDIAPEGLFMPLCVMGQTAEDLDRALNRERAGRPVLVPFVQASQLASLIAYCREARGQKLLGGSIELPEVFEREAAALERRQSAPYWIAGGLLIAAAIWWARRRRAR